MADHRRIIHLDDDKVLQADGEDATRRVVVHDEVLAIQSLVTTDAAYAALVCWEERAVLLPVAHIVPAQVGGNDREILRLLQDAIIN